MILGIALLLTSNAASLLAAAAICSRLRTGKASVDLLVLLVVRLFLISAVTIVAGTFGFLGALPLGGIGLAALIALLAGGALRHVPRLPAPVADRLAWVAAGVAALLLLRTLAQVWFFAPYGFDALSYHLTKIPEWIRAGAFTREMGPDSHAPFPAGFELIETWWVVFLHHDVLIEMAGVEVLLVAMLAVYGLAASVGLGRAGALLAAAIFSLTPAICLAATSCGNDLAVTSLVLTTMTFVATRLHPGLILLAAGLGLGVKPVYGYALPGVVLLWLWGNRDREPSVRSSRLCTALGIAGLCIGGYWYARNFFWYGNPIYPVGVQGLIARTGEKKIQFGPSLHSLYLSLSDLIETRITDHRWPYNTLLIYISGWGPLSLACGVPSLIAAARSNPAFRRLALALGASLLSVLLFVNHDPWCLRFVSFFPAAFGIATAWMSERVRETLAIAGLAGAAQFILTLLPADVHREGYLSLWESGWRERSVAHDLGAWSAEPAVAYFVDEAVHSRGESYLLYRPDYSCRVVYLRPTSPEDLAGQMRRQAVSVLYVSITTKQPQPLIESCLRLGLIEPMRERFYRLAAPP